ncbi:MAG: hypothetical protein FWG25_09520 [Promicromonosporaceae bacterium]|nr:hypothetical protein [Promicromonosporaceae bacterium]
MNMTISVSPEFNYPVIITLAMIALTFVVSYFLTRSKRRWVRRLDFFFSSILIASGMYGASIYMYFFVANENVSAATILNLAAIGFVIAVDKLETFYLTKTYYRLRETGQRPRMRKFLKWWINAVGVKAPLYLFYIVLLVATALDYPLGPPGYMHALRYGLLVLVATDKFVEQIFKDIRRGDARVAEPIVSSATPTAAPLPLSAE